MAPKWDNKRTAQAFGLNDLSFVRRGNYLAGAQCLCCNLSRRTNVRGRPTGRLLDLVHHPHHVPVLPGFDQLFARDAKDGNTGHVDGHAGWKDAQSGAGVLARRRPPNADLVALRERIVNAHVNFGESVIHSFEEGIKPSGPVESMPPSWITDSGKSISAIASRRFWFQTSSNQRRPRSRSGSVIGPSVANYLTPKAVRRHTRENTKRERSAPNDPRACSLRPRTKIALVLFRIVVERFGLADSRFGGGPGRSGHGHHFHPERGETQRR